MFLRLGYIVGQSGIMLTLLIVLVSKAITVLTTLSLSAIATNTRVRGGGAYFLISRSLGVESGGAIGIVFFLAQAIAVSLYCLGFAEAVCGTAIVREWSVTTVAAITNLGVFAVVMIGAGWTIRIQYGILAILAASLVSFFAGAWTEFNPQFLYSNFSPQFTDGTNVWLMFALFFPAVTGIMAGANMSGDLQDPARSIPGGTLLAVVVTGLVYLLLVVMLGATSSRETLKADNLVMAEVALVPMLITAGVLAATLSSALKQHDGSCRESCRRLPAIWSSNDCRFWERGAVRTENPGEPSF